MGGKGSGPYLHLACKPERQKQEQRETPDLHDREGSVCECEQPYSDYRDGQISPAMVPKWCPKRAVSAHTVPMEKRERERDRDIERERGQPGQNQSHGVPEEGQVSGKQIPVQLRRRSSGAQHQLLLPGHPDLCIRGLQSSCEG